MVHYQLIGYNSGGYRSSRTIVFDGKIEKCSRLDPSHPGMESYFKITHPDGTVSEEGNDFFQAILDEQSYIESFLVIDAIEMIE